MNRQEYEFHKRRNRTKCISELMNEIIDDLHNNRLGEIDNKIKNTDCYSIQVSVWSIVILNILIWSAVILLIIKLFY